MKVNHGDLDDEEYRRVDDPEVIPSVSSAPDVEAHAGHGDRDYRAYCRSD